MQKSRSELRPRLPSLVFGGLATAATMLLFAGCNSVDISKAEPAEFDSHLRHPILLSDEPEDFTMPVGMRGPALSPQIETALRDYVRQYRSDGTGSVTIQVPTGSANEVAAATTGHALHYALLRAGVPRGRIEVAPYEVGDHAQIAPLRLSYLRVKAVVPRCGIWPDGSAANFENTQFYNFGCAQQQNLAAMVDNPADFVRPRALTPADGRRRADVVNKWRQGQDPKSNILLIESGIGG